MEELDLKELFSMFWTRKVHIILITLIFMVIGAIYSYVFVTPKYMSYTTLLLATSSEDTNKSSTITTTDITLYNNLVSTYSELIRSKSVLIPVINNLNINKTEDALKEAITVSARKNTQIIEIDVIDSNPTEAKIIADEIAKVFMTQVSDIYKINNVHVVDEAEIATTPYNINHVKDIVMFAFIGLVVACIYVILANMLDTTVKTKEDVEKKLGLTVLTIIPLNNFDDMMKNNRKGGRR